MTETEINLFKELIRETVRSVLKEEKFNMTEEVKKTFAKDLKEIKLLIAKQIKEGRERPVQMVETKIQAGEPGGSLSESRAIALRNILTGIEMGSPKAPVKRPVAVLQNIKENKSLDATTKNILAQTAMDMAQNDEFEEIPTQEDYYSDEEIEEPYEPKHSSNF